MGKLCDRDLLGNKNVYHGVTKNRDGRNNMCAGKENEGVWS